jgi:hypothetical protein
VSLLQMESLCKALSDRGLMEFSEFGSMVDTYMYFSKVLDEIKAHFKRPATLTALFDEYDRGPQTLPDGRYITMEQWLRVDNAVKSAHPVSYKAWGPAAAVGIGVEDDDHAARRYTCGYVGKLVDVGPDDEVFEVAFDEIHPDVAVELAICSLTYLVYYELQEQQNEHKQLNIVVACDTVKDALKAQVNGEIRTLIAAWHVPYHLNFLAFSASERKRAYGDKIARDEEAAISMALRLVTASGQGLGVARDLIARVQAAVRRSPRFNP